MEKADELVGRLSSLEGDAREKVLSEVITAFNLKPDSTNADVIIFLNTNSANAEILNQAENILNSFAPEGTAQAPLLEAEREETESVQVTEVGTENATETSPPPADAEAETDTPSADTPIEIAPKRPTPPETKEGVVDGRKFQGLRLSAEHDAKSLDEMDGLQRKIAQNINVADSKLTASDVEKIVTDRGEYISFNAIVARPEQYNQASIDYLLKENKSFSVTTDNNEFYLYSNEQGNWLRVGNEAEPGKLIDGEDLPEEIWEVHSLIDSSPEKSAAQVATVAPPVPVDEAGATLEEHKPTLEITSGDAPVSEQTIPNPPPPGGGTKVYKPATTKHGEASPFVAIEPSRFIRNGRLDIAALTAAKDEIVDQLTNEVFKHDANADGSLNAAEAKKAIKEISEQYKFREVSEEKLQMISDGTPISLEEFREKAAKIFDDGLKVASAVDINKDGGIDEKEVVTKYGESVKRDGQDATTKKAAQPDVKVTRIGIGAQGAKTDALREQLESIGFHAGPRGSRFSAEEFEAVAQNFPQAIERMSNGYPGINPQALRGAVQEEIQYHRAEAENLVAKADGKGWFNKVDGIVTPGELAKLSRKERDFLQSQGVDLNRQYSDQNRYSANPHDMAVEAGRGLRGGQMQDAGPQTLHLTARQERAVGEILRQYFDGAGMFRGRDGEISSKDIAIGSKKHGQEIEALRAAGIRIDDIMTGKVVYDLSPPSQHDAQYAANTTKKHK